MLIPTAMKKITIILFLSMVLIFSAEAHKNKHYKATISIQTFYDQLSPYGDWIYSQDYGYVWRPYFDRPESFRPYSSNGSWVYTDYGWTWASGYDWGWATFHYGRWDFDNYLGWLWIPGYEWAPAWVSWGSYNNYWGWAPMGPNIYVNSNWYAPDPWWTFVPQNQFCSSNWNRYIYNRPVHVTNITHITNVFVNNNNQKNDKSWYYGPRVTDVERYGNSRVIKREIVDNQRPERTEVRNNKLNLYRPAVDNNRKDSRPVEYRNVEQVRTSRRVEQTDARTNDPGLNRTRDTKTETRSTIQTPAPRNTNSTSVKRVETRTGSQVPAERNSTRPSAEPERKTPDRTGNINVNEGNRPLGNTNRVVNTQNSQPRSTTPARENVNTNSARETGSRQTTSTQPNREQRTQVTAPAPATRTGNAERVNSTREEVKKADNQRSSENSEKRTTGSPARR